MAVAVALSACGGRPPFRTPRTSTSCTRRPRPKGRSSRYAPKPEAQTKPAIEAFREEVPGSKSGTRTRRLRTSSPSSMWSRPPSARPSMSPTRVASPCCRRSPCGEVDWAPYEVPGDQIFADDFVYVWAVPSLGIQHRRRGRERYARKAGTIPLDPAMERGEAQRRRRAGLHDRAGSGPGPRHRRRSRRQLRLAQQHPTTPRTPRRPTPSSSPGSKWSAPT